MTYSLILRRTLLAASAAALCLPAMAELADIKSAGKLRVGIDFGAPFYGYVDDKMKPVGSDVEAAELLAKDLGLELEFVPTVLSNRVPFLQTGKADIVVSVFAITPERAKVIDFSVPYAPVLVIVAAPKNIKITGPADLAGKKVISTRGMTNDQELTKIAPPGTQITRFDDDATSLTAMVSGQADIWVTTPMLMRTVNEKNPSRQLEVKFTIKANMAAVGMRKGEPRLKEKIDTWVRTNLKNGQLNAIYKKYHQMDLPAEVLNAGS